MEVSWLGGSKTIINGILLDTNILLYVYDGIDIFDEIIASLDYKPLFIIHKASINELTAMLNGKSILMRNKARVALEYLRYKKDLWIEQDDYIHLAPDDAILLTCKKYNYLLLTNDKMLKQKATAYGVKVASVNERGKIIRLIFTI